MSNYRVRQVLVLGDMPRRQLRFLVALATYLDDDSLSVRLGFATLTEAAGLSERWMKAARAELRDAKRIEYEPGRYRGDLTRWTVLCLPEKGAPIRSALPASGKGIPVGASFDSRKGVPDDPGRGHLNGSEGGTLESADQQEPERKLNLPAKPSSSLSSLELVARQLADLGGSEREIRAVIDKMAKDPKIRHVGAYLRKAVREGDGPVLLAEVRQSLHIADRMFSPPQVPPSAAPQRPAERNGNEVRDPEKLRSLLADTRKKLATPAS